MARRRGDWVGGILLATVLFNGVFLVVFLVGPLVAEPGLTRDLLWINLALRAGATALAALAYIAFRRQPQLAGISLLGAVLFILVSNVLYIALEGVTDWVGVACWLSTVLFMDWTVLLYGLLSYRFMSARGQPAADRSTRGPAAQAGRRKA